MEKRQLIFFVVSLLIIYVTMYYMKLTAPPPTRRPAPVPAQTAGAPEATTPTLAQAPAPGEPPAAPGQAETTPAAEPAAPEAPEPAPEIALQTDVYEITFSARGGVPIRWDIIDKRFIKAAEIDRKARQAQAPAEETQNTPAREHLIDTPLIENPFMSRPFETVLREQFTNQFYNEFNRGIFAGERISEGPRVGVRFTSKPTPTGLVMTKTYLFDPKSYMGTFSVELHNTGLSSLTFDDGATGLGVTLGPGLGPAPQNGRALREYVDTIFKLGNRIEYFNLGDPGKTELLTGSPIDWGGVQSKFFIATLIPAPGDKVTTAKALLSANLPETVLARKDAKYFPSIELYGPAFTIKPGQKMAWNYEWFAGPKQESILKQAGHDLDRVLFYNSWWWMRALCLGLMALLTWFHVYFHSWGVAIILLTILVRIVAFPFVQKGMKSQAKAMAEQARIKPLIDKLNEKFKDDPQRKQAEIFKLYKEHGINPLGSLKGCLWMLIQAPIFFALYNLLNQSIDLRGASFLWVQDLSQPDRLFTMSFSLPLIGNQFNLLPIITAVTQVLVSKVGMTPSTDEQQQQMQRMMVYFMPIFILIITYGFQAGLMLYWLISNIWQGLQQFWVNKHIKKPPMSEAQSPTPAKAKA
ncbi:MAG: membrane protein insertase YidC [bacterium]|nr:membrane protein insertase YidC [bacterium]